MAKVNRTAQVLFAAAEGAPKGAEVQADAPKDMRKADAPKGVCAKGGRGAAGKIAAAILPAAPRVRLCRALRGSARRAKERPAPGDRGRGGMGGAQSAAFFFAFERVCADFFLPQRGQPCPCIVRFLIYIGK